MSILDITVQVHNGAAKTGQLDRFIQNGICKPAQTVGASTS